MANLEKIMETYNFWRNNEFFDDETRKELSSDLSKKEIEDRFWKDLEFGTGGLRGIMGAGTNRMNKYIIRKATKGFADYLLSKYGKEVKRGVAIAFDSRNNSASFAEEASLVLAAAGIPVFIYDELQPTPVLSFTVRRLDCIGGIVITASHNPKEYNGYKVYDSEGCQVLTEEAEKIISYVEAVEDITKIEVMDRASAKETGLVKKVPDFVLDDFIKSVKSQSHDIGKKSAKIVYTPLHGTGNKPVRRVLSELGYDVTVVDEQEKPDGNFSTVVSPNPENADALSLGVKLCEKTGADVVLGTDPDCDRVGIAVNTKEGVKLFTGNQVGALLVNYVILMNKEKVSEKNVVVKTVVTSELGAQIAKTYGCTIMETLTGFKYIGEKITLCERTGYKFLIGYEESYGYLVGTHARDKDAVVSSMLICEMVSYYKNQGKTLVDVMNEIYGKYGYYLDKLDSFVFKGIDGLDKMHSIMKEMRCNGTKIFNDIKTVYDYSEGIGDLPKSDVLKFIFEDSSWIAIRPSGTEPKIKIYYSVRGNNRAEAEKVLADHRKVINDLIDKQ